MSPVLIGYHFQKPSRSKNPVFNLLIPVKSWSCYPICCHFAISSFFCKKKFFSPFFTLFEGNFSHRTDANLTQREIITWANSHSGRLHSFNNLLQTKFKGESNTGERERERERESYCNKYVELYRVWLKREVFDKMLLTLSVSQPFLLWGTLFF